MPSSCVLATILTNGKAHFQFIVITIYFDHSIKYLETRLHGFLTEILYCVFASCCLHGYDVFCDLKRNAFQQSSQQEGHYVVYCSKNGIQ